MHTRAFMCLLLPHCRRNMLCLNSRRVKCQLEDPWGAACRGWRSHFFHHSALAPHRLRVPGGPQPRAAPSGPHQRAAPWLLPFLAGALAALVMLGLTTGREGWAAPRGSLHRVGLAGPRPNDFETFKVGTTGIVGGAWPAVCAAGQQALVKEGEGDAGAVAAALQALLPQPVPLVVAVPAKLLPAVAASVTAAAAANPGGGDAAAAATAAKQWAAAAAGLAVLVLPREDAPAAEGLALDSALTAVVDELSDTVRVLDGGLDVCAPALSNKGSTVTPSRCLAALGTALLKLGGSGEAAAAEVASVSKIDVLIVTDGGNGGGDEDDASFLCTAFPPPLQLATLPHGTTGRRGVLLLPPHAARGGPAASLQSENNADADAAAAAAAAAAAGALPLALAAAASNRGDISLLALPSGPAAAAAAVSGVGGAASARLLLYTPAEAASSSSSSSSFNAFPRAFWGEVLWRANGRGRSSGGSSSGSAGSTLLTIPPPPLDSVAVILTVHRRPHLSRQLAALAAQSHKPASIHVIWNEPRGDEAVAPPKEEAGETGKGAAAAPPPPPPTAADVEAAVAAHPGVTLHRHYPAPSGMTPLAPYHGRFTLPLLLQHTAAYTLILDDDVIPGPQWIQGCLDTIVRHKWRALVTGNGRLLMQSPSGPTVGARYGDGGNVETDTEVDFGGHSWFFPTVWAAAVWGAGAGLGSLAAETASTSRQGVAPLHAGGTLFLHPPSLATGEDIHFSAALQLLGGIKTVVPGQACTAPEGAPGAGMCVDTDGSLGVDGVASYRIGGATTTALRDALAKWWMDRGWAPLAWRGGWQEGRASP